MFNKRHRDRQKHNCREGFMKPRTNWLPCFILCAGGATRIRGLPKQLLLVDDKETILGRIIRQTKTRGGTPVIVTHNQLILNAFPDIQAAIPSKRRWTCETLQCILESNTLQYHNLVFLGDVIYSRDLMDRVFRYDLMPNVFWGNQWEIYALSFRKDGLPTLKSAVQAAIDWDGEGKGKLRRVWQALYGLPQGDAYDKDLIQHVGQDDYSGDVDTLRDYRIWLIKSKGRLDDKA